MLLLDGFVIAGPTAGNPFTIEYAPTLSINGILVLVGDTYTGAVSPPMTGIDVNGVQMDIVDQSPFYHTNAVDDDATLLAFFLGSDLPALVAGEYQFTFQMDDTIAGASSVRGFFIHSTLGADIVVAGTGTDSRAGVTNPTYSMGPTTQPSIPIGLLVSGHDAVGSVIHDASSFDWASTEQDMGTRVASWEYPSTDEEFPASDPGTIDFAWTAASEDAGWFGVLLYEGEVPEPTGVTHGADGPIGRNAQGKHVEWKHRPYIRLGSFDGPAESSTG